MFLSTFFAVGILAIDVRGEGPPILENSNNDFAGNADSIDFTQPEFYHFMLWQDRNGDGKCTPSETSRLANLNAQIDLTSKEFADQQIYNAVVLDRMKVRLTQGGEQHELDLYNVVLDLPSI